MAVKKKFTLEKLAGISRKIKSGDYNLANEAVAEVISSGDPALFIAILGNTHIDKRGMLWVTPKFAVTPSLQQVVDYAFWQLLGLAPDEVWVALGQSRNDIQKICFRNYGEVLDDVGSTDKFKRFPKNTFSLQRCPEAICHFSELRELDCSKASVYELFDSLGNCTKLTSISLSRSQMTTLPDSFGSLVNLEVLELPNNRLSSLPDSFSNLTRLKKLNLSGNRFVNLPEVIGKLPSLEELLLDKNSIAAFPETTFSCRELRRLSICSNRIYSIPSGIGKLKNLTSLELEANQDLTEINPAITTLPNLAELNLINCTRLKLSWMKKFHTRTGVESFFEALKSTSRAGRKITDNRVILLSRDQRAKARMILPLLKSIHDHEFSAGLRLLEGSGDPVLADYCLTKEIEVRIPFKSFIAVDEPSFHGAWITTVEEKSRILVEFLSRPTFPTPDSNSWQGSIVGITLPSDFGDQENLVRAFPNLSRLVINFSEPVDKFSFNHLGPVNTLMLSNFKGSEIILPAGLTPCRHLVLDYADISESLRIKDCRGLERISLKGTSVKKLEISNCPDLKEIVTDASQRNARRYEPVKLLITDCPSLQKLILRGWLMDSVKLTGCLALERLCIEGKLPEKHPFSLEDVKRLKQITLSKAGLNSIPEFVFENAGLEELNLEFNKFNYLPDGFEKLLNLKELKISGNRLVRIPPVISQLNHLSRIDFGWQTYEGSGLNTLKKLEHLLGEAPSLEQVSIYLPELRLRKMAHILRKNRGHVLVSSIPG